MGDLEPQQSREMLIENLSLQVPKRLQFFRPSDSKYFLSIKNPIGGDDRMKKFLKRKEMLDRMKPFDRKLWHMIVSESVAQAADVGKDIGSTRPDFLALMFTGSNRVGLGDYRDPELDFRLITEDEPWEVIDMFKVGYGKRSRARDLSHWRETLGLKLGDSYFIAGDHEKIEPLSPKDLVLPASILDIGWNPDNGALAPISSEGGAYTRKSLDTFVLEPNRLSILRGRRGFERSLLPIIDNYGNLAANQLAFSTPIWVKKGEQNYVKGLIEKARNFVIPIKTQ